jgi:hypothetical protein
VGCLQSLLSQCLDTHNPQLSLLSYPCHGSFPFHLTFHSPGFLGPLLGHTPDLKSSSWVSSGVSQPEPCPLLTLQLPSPWCGQQTFSHTCTHPHPYLPLKPPWAHTERLHWPGSHSLKMHNSGWLGWNGPAPDSKTPCP